MTYPMTDKRKEIQMDCRNDDCKFYLPNGDCDNPAPAITLNPNGHYVCWSKKVNEKEYMYLYVKPSKGADLEFVGCILMQHNHRIDLQYIIDVQEEDAIPKLYMSTKPPPKEMVK